MFDTWRQRRSEPPEPNLIPVMNLMMTLIPFLLLGASFFHMAVIPTSTSQLTPNDSDVPKTPKQVSINLQITTAGFDLTASSTSLEEPQLAEMARHIPLQASGGHDIEALQQHLLGVKRDYPASNTILVFPHDALEYQALVEILDATREQVEPNAPPNAKRKPLFPVTVFNRLLPPPPPEDIEGAPGADGVPTDGTSPEGPSPTPAGGDDAADPVPPVEAP